MGLRLARLARGEDDRSVSPERKAKSISAETTFDRDYADAADLLPRLRQLSERVSSRLKRQGLCGRLVVLKLKSADFRLRTRNVHLDQRTNLADRVFRAGRDLLRKELDGTKYRLIGIGVGELADADLAAAHDLIDGGAEKRAQAERAMDDIRSRYGPDGLALGLTFTAKTPRGKPSAR
jgi:DNA polymerase-4